MKERYLGWWRETPGATFVLHYLVMGIAITAAITRLFDSLVAELSPIILIVSLIPIVQICAAIDLSK